MRSYNFIKRQIARSLSKYYDAIITGINGTAQELAEYFGPLYIQHDTGFEELVTNLDEFCKTHLINKEKLLAIVDNDAAYKGFTAKRVIEKRQKS